MVDRNTADRVAVTVEMAAFLTCLCVLGRLLIARQDCWSRLRQRTCISVFFLCVSQSRVETRQA